MRQLLGTMSAFAGDNESSGLAVILKPFCGCPSSISKRDSHAKTNTKVVNVCLAGAILPLTGHPAFFLSSVSQLRRAECGVRIGSQTLVTSFFL